MLQKFDCKSGKRELGRKGGGGGGPTRF